MRFNEQDINAVAQNLKNARELASPNVSADFATRLGRVGPVVPGADFLWYLRHALHPVLEDAPVFTDEEREALAVLLAEMEL